jgi:hypothetical protein
MRYESSMNAVEYRGIFCEKLHYRTSEFFPLAGKVTGMAYFVKLSVMNNLSVWSRTEQLKFENRCK